MVSVFRCFRIQIHTIWTVYKFLSFDFSLIGYLECFEATKNSFEQLSINYMNEKLQELCVNRLIKDELNWYKTEGLEVPKIEYLDNTDVLGELICILLILLFFEKCLQIL